MSSRAIFSSPSLSLPLPAGGRSIASRGRSSLGPADGVEHQRRVVRDQRRQAFLGVHHDAGDADDAGLAHRLAQQRVDLLALADRRGEVGRS